MDEKGEALEFVKSVAEERGYFLCPDEGLFRDLVDGLLTNKRRYSYYSCPCRIASGIRTYDSDIICPCEFCDADVREFDMCYCGLYVSGSIKDDSSKLAPIPERRPPEAQVSISMSG